MVFALQVAAEEDQGQHESRHDHFPRTERPMHDPPPWRQNSATIPDGPHGGYSAWAAEPMYL